MHLAERRGWQQLEQGFSINITVVAAVVVIAGSGESSNVPSHHLMYYPVAFTDFWIGLSHNKTYS